MKRSSIIEARRMHVNPLVRQKVELAFQKGLGAPFLQVANQESIYPVCEFGASTKKIDNAFILR